MKFALTCALALLMSGCAVYQVKPDEQTVRTVMERWAKEHGKSLKWDIEDLGMVEPEAINEQLRYTYDYSKAVSVFLNLAEKGRLRLAQNRHEPRPEPVMACIYDNAVWVTYHRGAAIACSVSVLPTLR